MHSDFETSEDCINHWSYGEICVHCGCCSYNPNYKDRIRRTIKYYKELLEEEYRFDDWFDDAEWKKIQERNVKASILWCKREIRRYKKILKTCK